MITETRIPEEKTQQSAEVAEHTAEFLAAGGAVQHIAPGVQTYRVLPSSSREAREASWAER